MQGYIYRITNIQTNKSYVGITKNFQERKKKHLKELNSNCHHSPKLQQAWNQWGAENFEWTVRAVDINQYDDLYSLEIEEIAKFDSYHNGYNCNCGGAILDWKQKVKNEDIVKFLCVQWKYGDGYGKTFEEIFGWSKGTASAAKRQTRFIDANIAFENLSDLEKTEIAEKVFNEYDIQNKSLKRQLNQGGCSKAYSLTADDYNFAFAAQSLGYNYTQVANYLGIKPNTVKDWFSGRARVKEKEKYEQLSDNEKQLIIQKVKVAQLELYIKDSFINKKEDDVLDFLCYDLFYKQNDMVIQRLFNWSEGTCYSIRKPTNYKNSKTKVCLMTEQERQERANKILNQLIGHV